MPIHDWTRVRANRFHDFHQKWTVVICNELNGGRLPQGYFAMVEQKSGGPEPDIITLELTPRAEVLPGGLAVDATERRCSGLSCCARVVAISRMEADNCGKGGAS